MTDQMLQATIRGLLANLTGDVDRTFEMNPRITSEQLPQDMPFEKAYLEMLETISRTRSAPTVENVRMGLRLKFNDANVDQRIDEILSHRTPMADVKLQSHMAARYLNEQKLREAHALLQDAQKPVGTPQERFEEFRKRVQAGFIGQRNEGLLTSLERLEWHTDFMARQAERKQKGLALGCQMPFRALQKKIPLLNPGDLSLWTAMPKSNKTTLATEIAEKNAWVHGVPMLVLLYETPKVVLQNRQYARHLLIPSDVFNKGFFDPRQKKYGEMVQRLQDKIRTDESERAYIIYQHCAGWSNAEVETAIEAFVQMCENDGYDFYGIVIDYLNKMEWGKLGQRESLVQNTEAVKVWCERYNAHIFLFAQEDMNNPHPEHLPFGSQEPVHKAQVHIAMVRAEPTEDYPLLVVNDQGEEVQGKDALGNLRFWHRETDRWDSRVKLEIAHANDSANGEIEVMLENALFRWQEVDEHESFMD